MPQFLPGGSFQAIAQVGETQTQHSSLAELRKPEMKCREDKAATFVDIRWRRGRDRERGRI